MPDFLWLSINQYNCVCAAIIFHNNSDQEIDLIIYDYGWLFALPEFSFTSKIEYFEYYNIYIKAYAF